MMKLGLIGYPIQHSLSPWIHKHFLERTQTNGEYLIYEINNDKNFAHEINQLKKKQLKGFNVTAPYKETIINYLDELDESVKKIGAVNTVLNKDSKWIGYNTDGTGYVKALASKYPEILEGKDKRILILGAGGAARGIYYAFLKEGFSTVDLANRTIDKAEEIIMMNEGNTSSSILTLIEAEKKLASYDILVQTTSVGMNPHVDESIISLHNIDKETIVSDIVYQPIKTKFLKEAETAGCSIHFGHTMLLHQAQLAFNIWTNQDVSVGNMDDKLQNILEG